MYLGLLRAVTLWIVFSTVAGTPLEVSVKHAGPAFFLKPVFQGQEFFSLNKQQKPFIVTTATGAGVFEAQYGPFHASERLSDTLLQSVLDTEEGGDHSWSGNRLIVNDLDTSAHVVASTISPERPSVQVLFHADQYKDYSPDGIYKSPTSLDNVRLDSTNYPNVGNLSNTHWCLRIYVQQGEGGQELSGECVLGSSGSEAMRCVATLTVPGSWWSDKAQLLPLQYALLPANVRKQCMSITPLPRSSDSSQDSAIVGFRRHLPPITLSRGQSTYLELKEDLHVLIYVPQSSFPPTARLRVPIKLQVDSDLTQFTIKLRVRDGLRVLGAEARNPTRWHISQEHVSSDRRATVSAQLDPAWATPSNRIESVFDWILEVDSLPTAESVPEGGARGQEDEAGRLVFLLSYTRTPPSQGAREVYSESGDEVRRKVHAKVELQYDNTQAIVPVIKSQELVNVAVLTGHPQNYPLQILALSHSGHVTDVTSQATCHSADDTVLKVSKSCQWVYLDGTESEGSPALHIMAKYGRHVESLYMRVWRPELPLSIQLSDDVLSQVRGWRVPVSDPTPGAQVTRDLEDEREEGEEDEEDDEGRCGLRFQQSLVEVYANFSVTAGGIKSYLAHRKALISVTELVLGSLRVADESVAHMRGNIVQGVQPGKTEIQVMSAVRGRALQPIAACELTVSEGREAVEFLQVELVTGMRVSVTQQPPWNRTLAARIHTDTALTSKGQTGILDVSVRFTDGKLMPLHWADDSEYRLELDTLNHHILTLHSWLGAHTPMVTALGPGRGELLKLSLEQAPACERRKSRALSVSHVHVVVDFSGKDGEEEEMQNIAPDWSDVNPQRSPGDDRKTSQHMDEAPLHSGTHPSQLSALEIGVYVLLAVICVAIVVFTVNCAVFVLRYKRKQGSQRRHTPVANANDWVWIGRETLQRNAIQTDCNQALMSEDEFTVNRTVARFLQPHSDPSSKRSSAASQPAPALSNRNSAISTYRGSECSIRITPNPLDKSTTSGTASDPGADVTRTVPSNRHQGLLPITHTSTLPRAPPCLLHTFHAGATGAAGANHPHSHHRHHSSTRHPQHSPHRAASAPARRVRGGECGEAGGGQLSDIQSASAMSASSSDEPSSFSSLPSRGSLSLRGSLGGTRGSRAPTPSQQARLAQVAQEMAQRAPLEEQHDLLAAAAAQIAEHDEDVANGNLRASPGEGRGGARGGPAANWDYEAMGMSYDQLMTYFDNLRESTA